MFLLLKALRKKVIMAKNRPQSGHSARNGNATAPYTKYNKTPHKYSPSYYSWRRDRLAGKPMTKEDHWKTEDRNQIRQFKMAAE